MYINKQGYLERKTHSKKSTISKASTRNWFFFFFGNERATAGRIVIRFISLPKEYIGKRIRLKITVEEVQNKGDLKIGRIKGWEKIVGYPNLWGTLEKIKIDTLNPPSLYLARVEHSYENKWYVEIRNNWTGKAIYSPSYIIMTDAIKFAKQYMRTHPTGV